MKRLGKWFVLFTVVVMSAVGFAACGDDGDEVSDSGILGKWGTTYYKLWKPNGELYYEGSVEDGFQYVEWTFHKNGTVSVVSDDDVDGVPETVEGKWNLNGNQLTLTAWDEEDKQYYSATYNVRKLDDTTLILFIPDPEEYDMEVTFRRLKN